MKILLINSDLAKNRGDRAIAEGVIELLKTRFPKAEITGISEQAARDKKWFGIDFLNIDTQSLKLSDFLQLRRAAKSADLVCWGGGEILKDYTNKSALWYWVIKLYLLSRVNPNIYGVYQGIGPTSGALSKRLIVFIVSRCRLFIVRDHESYQKLAQWGVDKNILESSSDPAILPKAELLSPTTKKQLLQDFEIDEAFLKNFISFGPRQWFNYKPGGFLPFKYKKKLLSWFGKTIQTENNRSRLYQQNLVEAVSVLTRDHNTNVLLIPMHMGESDRSLCEYVRSRAPHPEKIRILDQDSLSPATIRSVVAKSKAMIGFRLHSTIIAASAGVPCLNFYYVDKGRVFFDQIGQSRWALPIETVLQDDFNEKFSKLFEELVHNRQAIQKQLEPAVEALRADVRKAFRQITRDTNHD